MIRTLLTIVLPLIAPTVAYLVWMRFRAREREDELAGREIPQWRKLPWAWLITSGAVLAAVALVAVGSIGGSGGREQRYIPPYIQDGEVVPGRFEDRP